MWTYDLAREQAPQDEHLDQIARLTLESGFNALGLYLEHRFAYPSTPWAHGIGCLTPERAKRLQREFKELQIIPFINLLGHFEGMLYTEEGKQYREELFTGLQACPANPNFVRLCEQIIDDTVAAFDSELIHIGGDETQQLGASQASKDRIAELTGGDETRDGKAALYAAHFGPLADRVVRHGRRPAMWADMFHEHVEALPVIPKQTLMFEWQYFNGIAETAPLLTKHGFEVVGSPALHTYNATWLHVKQSEDNVREVTRDVRQMGLHGVCVTTWENALFGSMDTLFPALRACGQMLNGGEGDFYATYDAESPAYGQWARLMSDELSACGGSFTPGRIRSSLKTRFMLMANPFLLWMHHADEYCGPVGDRALAVLERALHVAPGEAQKGITLFARAGIEFVRMAEVSRREYAAGNAERAVAALAPARQLFDDLVKIAKRTNERIGGSMADIERPAFAKSHVETMMKRIRAYGKGELGYLPAYEILANPKFMPHDQASWWLINKWANQ